MRKSQLLSLFGVVWVLFNTSSGNVARGPHTFRQQSDCVAAASTHMRLSVKHDQFRCERMQGVLGYDGSEYNKN